MYVTFSSALLNYKQVDVKLFACTEHRNDLVLKTVTLNILES